MKKNYGTDPATPIVLTPEILLKSLTMLVLKDLNWSTNITYGILNVFAVSLYHLFEQHLFYMHQREFADFNSEKKIMQHT